MDEELSEQNRTLDYAKYFFQEMGFEAKFEGFVCRLILNGIPGYVVVKTQLMMTANTNDNAKL